MTSLLLLVAQWGDLVVSGEYTHILRCVLRAMHVCMLTGHGKLPVGTGCSLKAENLWG